MNLVESILTKNPCYTAGKTITVKGLMLHSVGCAQPSASVFIKNWNKESYSSACVHAFIDGNDGTVYQTLPWNHRGWHCGKGTSGSSANDTHIGVEMCEPGCIAYSSGANFTCSDTETAKAVAKRTYAAAVELFAYLCSKYSLDPTADGVIISHAEGYSRGVASNHADPAHLWKGLGLSYTMDTFRAAVKASMVADDGDMTDEEMFEYFKSQGLNDYGASGLMGNLYAESGLTANNLQNTGNKKLGLTDAEYTAQVDAGTYMDFVNDGYGYGLAQWTYYSRKQSLLDYMTAAGVSIGNKKKQCAFIMKELSGYTSVLEVLKNATSVKEASDAVLTGYEKPADQSDEVKTKRAGYGQTYYDKYASATSTSSNTIISESSLPAVPFTVKVIISDLNYRDQPSMSGAVKGQTGIGTFTITEASNGWGKLKSGAGWIYLLNTSYCTIGSTVAITSSTTSVSTSSVPYMVKVTITDLNIRTGPGTNYSKTSKQTGKGTFTIVEESDGEGSTKGWGLLKAYQSTRKGWISLDYAAKV